MSSAKLSLPTDYTVMITYDVWGCAILCLKEQENGVPISAYHHIFHETKTKLKMISKKILDHKYEIINKPKDNMIIIKIGDDTYNLISMEKICI